MLECKACIHRCIRTILADVLPLRGSPHLLSNRNTFSSLSARSARDAYAKAVLAKRSSTPPVRAPGVVNKYGYQKANAVARGMQYPRTAIEKELWHLKDPLKLANHIRDILRNDDEKKALELVRAASKNVKCTVSWNHLIDYGMNKGRVNSAVKLYNEMKKRAIVPDAHTYTILFRGLAEHASFPNSIAKALSLYESMYAPNSPIKPSVKHTNAVLKVCARAKDLDSMWAIAAKLPARGLGAPDNLTFTTILNALYQDVSTHLDASFSDEEKSIRVEKAILHGRRMWDDIMGRWRTGDIWIDEELVCAMGRLLLVGLKPRDWDDVLSLVEQTMAVPRLLPRLGTPAREDGPAPQLAAPDDAIFQNHGSADGEPEAGGEFDPVDISKVKTRLRGGAEPAAYARPGGNTLSLILAACLKMRVKQAGQDYWALLTNPNGYAVSPDADNYRAYMRFLRQSRAMKEAVTVLRSAVTSSPALPATQLRIPFRIAMSTCARDKASPYAFRHASQILDLMQSALADPDVRTCTRYLELATSTNDGATIARALGRLNRHTLNLKSLLSYGSAQDATKVRIDEAKDAIELIKLQVSCCDRLMDRGEVGREEYGTYAMRRSKLAAWVTRWNTGDGWVKSHDEGDLGAEAKEDGEEEAGERTKRIRRGGRMVRERLEKRRRREEREREREMDRELEKETQTATTMVGG